MAPKSARITVEYSSGQETARFASWRRFVNFAQEEMLDYRHFIWRGQANSSWLLEPTLERLLKHHPAPVRRRLRDLQLARFKLAARGRRGATPPPVSTDKDWWALGQHNGLATPMLDWTRSPFVAAYFAYLPENNGKDKYRAIFGLSRTWVQERSADSKSKPTVKFVEPQSDENPRLVNQGGLFTYGPEATDLEAWVKANHDGEAKVRLFKLLLPNRDRLAALRALNRMNINHLSLFPDLYGASKFVNLDLVIPKY